MKRIVIHVLILSVIILFFSCSINNPKSLKAVKGTLDLTKWDFEKDGTVKLDGEWEFYWKKLLTPKDFKDGTTRDFQYFIFPYLWNGTTVGSEKISGIGYATFRLRVLLNDDMKDKIIALLSNEQATSYRIFINDKELMKAGIVTESPDTSKPHTVKSIGNFNVNSSFIDIVLNISNYNHRNGGIWYSLILGNYKQINSLDDNKKGLDFFLAGALFIMAIYHIGLFALRRKDKSALIFAAFCLVILFRLISTGEKILLELAPETPFDIYIRLEYISFFLIIPLGLHFIYSLFPNDLKIFIVRIFYIIAIMFALFVLFFPSKIYSYLIIPYEGILLIGILVILIVIIKAIIAKRIYANIIFFGILIMVCAAVHDLLYLNQIISGGFLAPFGFLFMIFSQTFVLSIKFSKAFKDLEDLSVNLEKNVEERSVELYESLKNQNKLNKELEEKNKKLIELDKLKDNFITNVSHELRTPLTSIQGFSKVLSNKYNLVFPYVKKDDMKIGKISYQIKDNLVIIDEEIKVLHKIVDKIINFAEIESNKVQWSDNLLNINELIDNILKYMELTIKNKNIEIIKEFDKDIENITVDENKISCVIKELLDNAISYTKSGYIKFVTKIIDREIVVSIEDSGVGIDDETKTQIFNKFKQGGNILTDKKHGLGLGLSYSKLIVDHYKGRIWVESELGKGSIFSFSLPRGNLESINE